MTCRIALSGSCCRLKSCTTDISFVIRCVCEKHLLDRLEKKGSSQISAMPIDIPAMVEKDLLSNTFCHLWADVQPVSTHSNSCHLDLDLELGPRECLR
jgi:hypothetical protein